MSTLQVSRWFVFAATLSCVAAPVAFQPAASADSLARLELATQRMEVWLVDSPKGDAWRTPLDLPTLEHQLVLGYQADPVQLQEVSNRFSRHAAGHPVFESVREAIDNHVQALNHDSQPFELHSTISQLTTSTYTREQLDEARTRAIREIDLMLAYYRQKESDVFAENVASELNISDLKEAISTPLDFTVEPGSPDEKQLKDHVQRLAQLKVFKRNNPQYAEMACQLNDEFFAMADMAIGDYASMVYQNYLNRFRSEQLNAFTDRNKTWLEKRATSLPSDRTELPSILSRFHSLKQDDLVRQIKRYHSHPNLMVDVSENLANRLGSQSVSESDPVRETILGRDIQGHSHTQGNVRLDFVSNPNQAHLSIHMLGQVNTNSSTQEGPITAYSQSFADIEARRSVVASISGFEVLAPYVAANMGSSFSGTSCRLRLVNRIANRQFEKEKSKFEAVGAYKAEQKLHQQFSEQTNQQMASGKQQLHDGRKQLYELLETAQPTIREKIVSGFESGSDENAYLRASQLRLKIPRFAIRTTDTHLQIVSRSSDVDQVAASTVAPPVSPNDVSLRLHESYLSNLASNFVKGTRLKSTDLPGLIRSFADDNELDVEMDPSKPWSLRFANGRPVEVRFDNDRVTFVVSASEFRSGTNVAPVRITLPFRIVNDGALWLVSEGKPEVTIMKDGQLGLGDTAIKSLLNSQIGDALKKAGREQFKIRLPANLIPSNLGEQLGPRGTQALRHITLQQLQLHNGWLSASWNYDDSPTVSIDDVDPQTPSLPRPAINDQLTQNEVPNSASFAD